MQRVLKFFFWSDATKAGWLFGMVVRLAFWLSVISVIIALAVLNRHNPAYNPTSRAALDAQAQALQQTSTIEGERWRSLIRSASAECHYRANPQEFIVSGSLPDEYIEPNTGAIRWFVRFPANLQPTLFGPQPHLEAGVATMGGFYATIQTEGFRACTDAQSTTARGVLGI